MVNKLIIGIDVDDTMVDTRGAIHSIYSNIYGSTKYKPVLNYQEMCVNFTEEQISTLFLTGMIYTNVKVIDEYLFDTLSNIKQKHSLMICSLHKAAGISYKIDMLNSLNISNYFDNQIYLTDVYSNKDVVCFDVLIDDNIKNILTNKSTYKILFDRDNIYANLKDLPCNVYVVRNWSEVDKLIKEFENE